MRRSIARQTVATTTLALALWAGCASTQTHLAGRSSEDQAIAEYDLARDFWINRGQPRRALEHVLRAIELDDENADAAHLAALVYLDFCRRGAQDCHLRRAERHARDALELRSDFREARNTLGVVLIHLGSYQDSIATLKPLTEDILYSTPEKAWGNVGWAYLRSGALTEARDALERSVAAQPDFCVGHYRLGLTYERRGEADRALEAFTSALRAAGGRCQGLQAAYAGRARVLLSTDREDEARSDLQTCVRLDKRTDAGRECIALQSRSTVSP